MLPTEAVLPARWRARLELGFERRGERSVLARRRHEGPLRVQKALHPEGGAVCHAILLHPPSGIAGGDDLAVEAEVDPHAHALLTTPGAGKWYRSAGLEATQRIALKVDAGAALEWLPQENIVFDGAIARMTTDIELAPDARLVAWDILCLGRSAAGERFARGRLVFGTRVTRAGRPIWREQGLIDGGAPLLDSPAGMAGEPVAGVMLVSGRAIEAALVARLRAIEPASGRGGVTRLPDTLVARYLGPSAEAARNYFMWLWQILRPALLDRAAVPPRIWNT